MWCLSLPEARPDSLGNFEDVLGKGVGLIWLLQDIEGKKAIQSGEVDVPEALISVRTIKVALIVKNAEDIIGKILVRIDESKGDVLMEELGDVRSKELAFPLTGQSHHVRMRQKILPLQPKGKT